MHTQEKTRPLVRCFSCKQGDLHPFEAPRTFAPPTGEVTVMLLRAKCDACACETSLSSQQDENLRRLRQRKAAYGPHLLGEEIFSFRRAYGLRQQDAAKLFGKGKVAFSRYENETSYPDRSMNLLLKLAMSHTYVLKELADEAGVIIPLWPVRSADLLGERPVLRGQKPVEAA